MNSAVNASAGPARAPGRPVVGICARTAPITLQGSDMIASLALQTHVDFLASAGCTPLVLPLSPGGGHVVDQLDGLLIPGGPDVDPELYGAAAHPSTRVSSPAMDAAELALIEKALGIGLPVLGICRGMQLLNVQCGGTLHQHLPEITGDAGHRPQSAAFMFGWHRLDLRPGSRISAIIGDDIAETPCHHHQAVDRIGTGLIATAWAPDGVIEAVEATGHPFAVGVQWEAGHTTDDRLHIALADAARNASPRGPARS